MYTSIIETENSYFGMYAAEGMGTGGIWGAFYAYVTFALALALYLLIKLYRHSEDERTRRSAMYFLLAVLYPLIGTIASFLTIAIAGFFLKVQLTLVFLTFSGITIMIGIIKDDLFDIHVIVKKSFVYTLVTVVLGIVFLVVVIHLISAVLLDFQVLFLFRNVLVAVASWGTLF